MNFLDNTTIIKRSILIVFITVFFSLNTQADENCSMRSDGLSSFRELSSNLKKATWYNDRDNSMTKLSTEEGIGAAMVIIDSKSGYTQGIQVCPGVYLATGHGVMDAPWRVEAEGRDKLRTLTENMKNIVRYPFENREYRKIREPEDAEFISSHIEDLKKGQKIAKTDYVFIKVKEQMRPENHIRPLMVSDSEFKRLVNDGTIDFRLHRQPTLYETLPDGRPDFNYPDLDMTFERIEKLYDAPLVVNEPCSYVNGLNNRIPSTNCPSENGVSGSSFITNIDGEDFLVGMLTRGKAEEHKDEFNPKKDGNAFIPSNLFCKDYEKACGVPCPNIEDVLPKHLQDMSI
jgi:hypothetical protein